MPQVVLILRFSIIGRVIMKHKKILPLRPCEQCWETFQPTQGKQKYCSDICRRLVAKNKQRKVAMQSMVDGTGGAYLKLRFTVFRRDGFTCQYCGRTIKDGIKLNADHIIPKSKSGGFSLGNLITACFDCNQGKDDVILTKREIEKLKDFD